MADEAETLVARTVAARDAGDRAGLAAAANDALSVVPANLVSLVQVANVVRDAGLLNEAERVLQHINAINPHSGFGHYELAILHLLRGDHVQALLTVETQLSYLPFDVRANILAARLYNAVGAYFEGEAALRRAHKLEPSHPDLRWLAGFAEFLKEHPANATVYRSRLAEGSSRYLDAGRLAARIRAALDAGTGFSMVRLGDGEGAFCRISDADEARYQDLYRHNRDDRARVWFNGQIDLEDSGFNRVALGLRDVIRQADVVGLPYTTWVEHEYRIQSPTGVSSLTNALRLATMPGIDVGQQFCRQSVHIELHQHDALASFVRSQKRIGLISCHSALPEIMKAHFGLDDVFFLKIPGEKLFEEKIGRDASAGVHFPDRYEQIMGELSRPLDGLLFLVAGGILGKFYCQRIKKSGGIALDIGSLADAWLGLSTRPGYESMTASLSGAA